MHTTIPQTCRRSVGLHYTLRKMASSRIFWLGSANNGFIQRTGARRHLPAMQTAG